MERNLRHIVACLVATVLLGDASHAVTIAGGVDTYVREALPDTSFGGGARAE